MVFSLPRSAGNSLRTKAMSKHVFGPVPSRRLGRSLGVDLVPFKTCSYDCIYCQLGCTSCKTIERKEWVRLEEVLAELKTKLAGKPDYITLSGSGEPTLFARTAELIQQIKTLTNTPIAVLTNGSLFWRDDVRRDLMLADLVIPSLDAGDEAMFQLVNRPHEDISFEKMLAGLIAFRKEFQQRYWLEIFIIAGYTDSPDQVGKLVQFADLIQPDKVQLNTVTRPPAEPLSSVPPGKMDQFAQMFHVPVEVIADYRDIHQQSDFVASREEVLQMLRRRPCSVDEVAAGLGIHRNEALKHIEELTAGNLVNQSLVDGRLYYQATQEPR